MEIKRLKELIVKKPQYGLNNKGYHNKKNDSIAYLTQSNLLNYKKIFTDKVKGYENFLIKKNDFFFSRAGTIDSWYAKKDINMVFAGYIIRYYFDQNIVLNQFLFFWTKKNKKLFSTISKTGTTMPKMNPPDFLNIKICLPSINEQQQIINIIEPFENLQNYFHNMNDFVNKTIDEMIKLFNNLDITIGINHSFQGYAFTKDEICIDGKFNIYKIGNILTFDSEKISKTNICKSNLNIGDVVTGLSGTIGTSSIIYNNNFVLNQRLICIRSKIPLIIKSIIEKNKTFLNNIATGSVQKNITALDILNLKYDKRLDNDFTRIISKYNIIINKKLFLLKRIINNLIMLYVK